MQAYPCVTAANRRGDRPPDRPHISPYRLAAMGFLLACLGAWGVVREASAQTVNGRLGTAPFAPDALTRVTATTRSDTLDVQHPVGFEPHASKSMDRFHLVAAAERSAVAGGGSGAAPADGQANAAELAKKLQNPVADLISVPLQNNWDFGIGPADAMRYTVNIQPVIPVSLTHDWNLIIRTILPVIYAESPVPGGDTKAGLGDITQSFLSVTVLSRVKRHTSIVQWACIPACSYRDARAPGQRGTANSHGDHCRGSS